MIYFDNAATTRALPAVAEKMSTMLCEQYGNPASVSAMGLAAEKEIRNAAEIIARGIHCKYDEVFFTSGGTEGDNWAIYGTADRGISPWRSWQMPSAPIRFWSARFW